MKKLNALWLLAALFVLAATSCKKKTPDPVDPPEDVLYEAGKGVFVGNEGGFQKGEASVYYYKFADKSLEQNVFTNATGLPLGDICHSMMMIGDELYVVVNNSGKIEVVNPANFKSIRTIQGFNSPRFIAKVANNKAYVTNIFGNGVDVVDLGQGTITKTIAFPGWSEEMAVVNGKVFITNYDRQNLYVLDPTSDKIIDSISVNIGGISVRQDANGKLWVLCSGDYQNGTPGSLHRISPATLSVEKTYTFQPGEYPTKLRFNKGGTTMYMILQGIRKMDITDNQAPDKAFIKKDQHKFYALDVDPATGEVYVGDAIDYTSSGLVYRYSTAGATIDSFEVGVSPSSFLFY